MNETKAQIIVQMNEIISEMAHMCSLGKIGTAAEKFFARNENARLCIPELKIDVRGYDGILKTFHDLEDKEGFAGAFHMLHSGCYEADECEGSVGAIAGKAQWNTHSVILSGKENDGYTGHKLAYLRILGEFTAEKDSSLKIRSLNIRLLVCFPEEKQSIRIAGPLPALFPLSENCVDPDTYIEIRNMLGRFSQEDPVAKADLFDKNTLSVKFHGYFDQKIESCDELKNSLNALAAAERKNRYYHSHFLSAAPMIRRSGPSDDHAG